MTTLKKNKLLEKKKQQNFLSVHYRKKKKHQTPNHIAAETYSVLVFFRTGLFSHLPPSYGLGISLGDMLEGKALPEFMGTVVLQLWSGVA